MLGVGIFGILCWTCWIAEGDSVGVPRLVFAPLAARAASRSDDALVLEAACAAAACAAGLTAVAAALFWFVRLPLPMSPLMSMGCGEAPGWQAARPATRPASAIFVVKFM